jgi:hypothetical protein
VRLKELLSARKEGGVDLAGDVDILTLDYHDYKWEPQ